MQPSQAQPTFTQPQLDWFQNDFPQVDQQQLHNQVLETLGDLSRKANKNERMTWNALYSLKQQQIVMHRQMLEEIDRIKDRYEILKDQVHRNVSKVTFGKQIKSEDMMQFKGAVALPQFWKIVFIATGLMVDESEDAQCFDLLDDFTCETIQAESNTIKLAFSFSKSTPIFTNKNLELTLVRGQEPQITVKQPICFREGKGQNSIFREIFCAQDKNQCARVIGEIYQNYKNSLYFYLQGCRKQNKSTEPSLSGSPRKQVKNQ